MISATPAPTIPTSSEMRAPYITRVNTSRPCTSVPNQWAWPGGANCASEVVFQEYGAIHGQISTSSTSTANTMRLITAGLFRRNRRHARWLGLRCSIILHPRIEQAVTDVDEEIEHQQQNRVEHHQPDDHRVVTV